MWPRVDLDLSVTEDGLFCWAGTSGLAVGLAAGFGVGFSSGPAELLMILRLSDATSWAMLTFWWKMLGLAGFLTAACFCSSGLQIKCPFSSLLGKFALQDDTYVKVEGQAY